MHSGNDNGVNESGSATIALLFLFWKVQKSEAKDRFELTCPLDVNNCEPIGQQFVSMIERRLTKVSLVRSTLSVYLVFAFPFAL